MPDPLDPIPNYVAQPPDHDIDLGSLDVEYSLDGTTRIPIAVSVKQKLLPSQRVQIVYNGPSLGEGFVPQLGDGSIYWKGSNTKIPVFQSFRTTQHDFRGEHTQIDTIIWEAYVIDLPICAQKLPYQSITAHLLSFPDFMSQECRFLESGQGKSVRCSSTVLIFSDWKITISAHSRTKQFHESLSSGSSFAITHTAKVERVSGVPFAHNEYDAFSDLLYWFLAFSVGRRIGIGLEYGSDGSGSVTQLSWGFKSPSRWNHSKRHCWWDLELGQVDLNGPFGGFCVLFQDAAWKDHIQSIIYMYLEANQMDRGAVSTDTGVVLSQIALEKAAWVYLVLNKKSVLDHDFDKISASGKIRAAAAMLNLPLAIPDDIAAIITSKNKPPEDIPHLITEIRNNTVHPKPKSNFEIESYRSWNLAQWYVELMILRLSGHEGKYNNRAKITKYRTAAGYVPWVTPPPTQAPSPNLPVT